MAENDRPVLGLDVEFQIETATNQIHQSYWPQLEQLQETTPEQARMLRDVYPTLRRPPPSPKRPQALRYVLYRYAASLFESEATFYPNDSDHLVHWLARLRRRVVERTLQAVTDVEAAGRVRNVSLSHHGVTESDMRSTMEAAMEERTMARLATAVVDQVKSRFATAPTDASPTLKEGKPKRISTTIHCPKAARKMEDYIAKKGLDQTKFAIKAGTTDRTLRRFRKTGRIKRAIFEEIAKAMGTTKEALLSD
jgi:hypothetical protein